MKEIALHLLDILENSAKGGATGVTLDLERRGSVFHMRIVDNGPGLPPAVRLDPTDPFSTTRRERPVGLGLALLRMAAEHAGGGMQVRSPEAGGVEVEASFNLQHIDAQPLGGLDDVLATALASWPALNLIVRVGADHQVVLNTWELKTEINGIDFSNPKVHKSISTSLREALSELSLPE
ncbi:MAG: ATP-binding protein [Kiritimatiellia bacterium]|nr:ATP-binding protein [Lentisphaerota bacterium]